MFCLSTFQYNIAWCVKEMSILTDCLTPDCYIYTCYLCIYIKQLYTLGDIALQRSRSPAKENQTEFSRGQERKVRNTVIP
jgi:hypothetical protein